jgi:hypothetical protein
MVIFHVFATAKHYTQIMNTLNGTNHQMVHVLTIYVRAAYAKRKQRFAVANNREVAVA